MTSSKQSGGTALAEAPRKKGYAEVTIPVRILNAVNVAFKQDTRYAMSSLLVQSRVPKRQSELNTIEIIATDGRRMMIVRYQTDLFDRETQLNMIVPGDVARAALRTASKSDSEEPMATLVQKKNVCTLKVDTPSGESISSWKTDGDTLPFPPYADVVPDFSLYGVSEIGVSPARMAKTLLVVEKIIGTDHNAKLFMPQSADQPVGVEATDGAAVNVLAIVMPTAIGEWTKTENGDDEEDDEDQQQMFEQWRGFDLGELKLSAGLHDKLVAAGLITVGQLADYISEGKDIATLEGVGRSSAEKVEAALATFYKDKEITPPAKAATPEQKAADDAAEMLMAYTGERFKAIGVPAEVLKDPTDKLGEQMDELIVAQVMTKAEAKDARASFESADAATLKGWHDKLKGLNDDAYRKAATDAGFKFKKTVLPS